MSILVIALSELSLDPQSTILLSIHSNHCQKLTNVKHNLKSLKNATINRFNGCYYYYNTKYDSMQLEQLYATSIAPVLIFRGINWWCFKFIHKTPCHSRSQSELETARQTVEKNLTLIVVTTNVNVL